MFNKLQLYTIPLSPFLLAKMDKLLERVGCVCLVCVWWKAYELNTVLVLKAVSWNLELFNSTVLFRNLLDRA